MSETEIIRQALDGELAAGFIHVPRFDSEAMSQAFQFMHPRRFRLMLPQNPITGTANCRAASEHRLCALTSDCAATIMSERCDYS